MKIGIFADIHGDISNLKLLLDFFQKQQVEKVICSGDLIDRGANGESVVKLMQERNIPTVQGNHDATPFQPKFLTPDTIQWLLGLPEILTYNWRGFSITVAHGTPWDQWTYLQPTSPETMHERVANEAGSDIVILGHTHKPMIVNVRQGAAWIFNPGSSSRFATSLPTCAVLTLPTNNSDDFDFRVYTIPSFDPVRPHYLEVPFQRHNY